MAWSETAGKLGHRIGDITVALKNGTTDTPQAVLSDEGKVHVLPYLWNPNSLAFEVSTGGSTPGANVTVTNFPATQAVTGPLTDAQLRATPVPVSGTIAVTGGVISTNNSSTALLGSGATFTGTAEDITQYASIVLTSFSDVASGANGLQLQYSSDGVNWDEVERYTTVAGTAFVAVAMAEARYFRVVYVNGGAAQSSFRLQVIYKTTPPAGEVSPLDSTIRSSHESVLTRSVIVGVTTAGGGAYVPVKVNPSGSLTVTATLKNLAGNEINPSSSDVTQPVSGTFWQATQPVSQPAATDWRIDQRRGLTPLFAVINVSGAGDNTLVAADATKKVKVLQYTLIAAGTVSTTFKSGASTSLSGAMPLVANSGAVSPYVPPASGHLMETAVNQALVLNLSGAVAVTGHLTYVLEA